MCIRDSHDKRGQGFLCPSGYLLTMKKDSKNDEEMISACEEALQCGLENGDILAESSDDDLEEGDH